MRNAAPRTWRRDALTAAACGMLGWLAFGRGGMVPVLGHVDVAFHELGHHMFHRLPVSDTVTAAAGSVAQLLVPMLLAAYFLLVRRERAGGALCLAWAATSAAHVAAYIADAAHQPLPLVGAEHDWVVVLGALDRMDQAATIAAAVHGLGLVLLTAALVTCAWSEVRAAWAAGADSPAAGTAAGALAPVAPVRRLDGRSPAV